MENPSRQRYAPWMHRYHTAQRFVTIQVWQSDSFWAVQLRKVILVLQGIWEDATFMRASALTYTTLLSMVPLLAAIILVIKGFGQGQEGWLVVEQLQGFIDRLLPMGLTTGEGVALSQIFAESVYGFAQKLSTTKVGTIGVAGLILSATALLRQVEGTINRIWVIPNARRILYRVLIYWALISLVPVLLLTAFSSEIMIRSQAIMEWGWQFIPLPWLRATLRSNLPSLIGLSIMFTLLYFIVPNTRVKIKSALVGGIGAGVLMHLTIKSFGHILSLSGGVTEFKLVYGALALIPLLLMFIYVAWVIMLIGAEIAFADQNAKLFVSIKRPFKVAFRFRMELALRLMLDIAEAFRKGAKPPTILEFNHQLRVPIYLIRETLRQLERKALLTLVDKGNGHYVPKRSLSTITIRDVWEAAWGKEERFSLPPDQRTDAVRAILARQQDLANPVLSEPLSTLLKN